MGEAPTGEENRDHEVVAGTLEFLARSLVANPDQVSVEIIPGERTVFRLTVDPADLGRVIGRGGRTARAIRQVTRAAATKTCIHAFIEIAG